ncbi:hypothetical protein E4U30_005288 [Claviceps sp. LM220 group G6]|nr:hypothetical protein E4U30_005288 [Claviceps sp. LM220 group G6]KAG6113867.1 hypothetical protein E4U31_007637 [Claviceps sp. LM219 group G6]
MATPATLLRIRDSDDASRHTRDVEPTSPTNFQHLKRQRAVITAPKRLDLTGKGAGSDITAQAFLGKHLDDLIDYRSKHRDLRGLVCRTMLREDVGVEVL